MGSHEPPLNHIPPVIQILESSPDSSGVQNLLDHIFLLALHDYWWRGRSSVVWERILDEAFRRETWNTEWILRDSGSCIQKAAEFSCSVIANDPKYLWPSFADGQVDCMFWADNQTLSSILRLEVS